MLPFGIGFGEIIAIFLVLIIFVGPEGIPQAVRAIAKVIRSIRNFVDDVRYSPEFDEVKREILDPIDEARRFNPTNRTREWMRRELEEPIKSSLTDDPVEDFHHQQHFHDDHQGHQHFHDDHQDHHHVHEVDQLEGHLEHDGTDDFPNAQNELNNQDQPEPHLISEPTSHDLADEHMGGDTPEEDDDMPIMVSAVDPLERDLDISSQSDVQTSSE